MNTALLNSMLWTAVGFFSGSLMFAFWAGKVFLKEDIRNYGTGNPGAVSAWKAGGWKLGLPVGIIELAKGLVPVGLAIWVFGVSGWYLVPVALAPMLGHAFSPFLKFKGGRALAAALGAWTAITIWEGLVVLGVVIGILYVIFDNSSWANIWGMLAFLAWLVLMGLFVRGVDYPLLAIWAGNMGIFLIKHWSGLKEPIRLRPNVARFVKKSRGFKD